MTPKPQQMNPKPQQMTPKPQQMNPKPQQMNPTTGGERKGQLYKDAITVEGAKLQHGELFKQPR